MTNENYTKISNDELLNIIYEIKVSNKRLKLYLAHHNNSLYNEIISRTYFLDDFYGTKNVPI